MIRDNIGRFYSWRIAIKRFFKRLFWITIGICVILAGAESYRRLYPNEITVVVDRPVMLDNLTNKINELKGKLISDLKNCESGGYKEEDGLLVWDSNQRFSIGTFQFQKSTVQHYSKTLYGKEISGKEAILIALDDDQASQLASDIIFTTGKLSDWANCDKKAGLTQQLKVIQAISK